MVALILGNGESRLGVNYREEYPGAFVYGCNGAYKESPDALICSDIYMQHIIYKTGYCKDNLCYFNECAPVPSGAAEHIIMALKENGLPVIENAKDTTYGLTRTQAVISGSANTNYVTWVDDKDMVMMEGRKKTGTKLCARGKASAKAKYDVYPSAYSNGHAVQVCKGKIKGLDGKRRCSPPFC